MKFETEYAIEEFRKIQPDLFDEDGKKYTGTRMSDREAEHMLKLIDMLERDLRDCENKTVSP